MIPGTHTECVWTTVDRKTGRRVQHFKTLRNSDGVCIGEHTEEFHWAGYGRTLQWVSGTPDMDHTTREDLQQWRAH